MPKKKTQKVKKTAASNPLGIMDTTLRDGHQCLLATRMRIEDMLPVLDKLEQGHIQPAINLLYAFINQVLSLVDEGVLTPEEGQNLVDAVQAAIDQLSE